MNELEELWRLFDPEYNDDADDVRSLITEIRRLQNLVTKLEAVKIKEIYAFAHAWRGCTNKEGGEEE